MIINGTELLKDAPIEEMFNAKHRFNGTSHGLAEAGYDIRINQDVEYTPATWRRRASVKVTPGSEESNITCNIWTKYPGRFCLASAIEKFQMPQNLVGIVHDKSTWARKGLSVFNTVIEPGWHGYLTLELVFHSEVPVKIQRGQGIAQVIFSETAEDGDYGDGKYQNAGNFPQTALA